MQLVPILYRSCAKTPDWWCPEVTEGNPGFWGESLAGASYDMWQAFLCGIPLRFSATLKPTPKSRDGFRDRIWGKVLEKVVVCVQYLLFVK